MANPAPRLIGIDGGGTKTVAWLASMSGDVVGRGIAGPGNPRAVGFETAQANIDAAIDDAFDDAKQPRESVAAACFGLAGCGRADEQRQMVAWSERRGIAYMIKVTDDAEPILAAAAPNNFGVALICGTGSLAWGRRECGETARAGGWGYLIGDEGSGYAIALAGLRAAVCAADGRGPTTELLARFQEVLQADNPNELIGRVYQPEMSREKIASLARAVFEVGPTDAVASEILRDGALQLAKMVAAVVERLRLSPGAYPLALAGGVLRNQPAYRQLLGDELNLLGAAPASATLVTEPVRGAVELAKKLATAGPARK